MSENLFGNVIVLVLFLVLILVSILLLSKLSGTANSLLGIFKLAAG